MNNQADEAYLNLVRRVLDKGTREVNRTGVDTLAVFAEFYRVDLSEGFPLLTTKKVNFNAVLHELLWYISGVPHIRDLREKTKIWDEWATPEGHLETAYGRYWRHYPLAYTPHSDGFKALTEWGEAFATDSNPYVKYDDELGWGFDQLKYIVDELTLLKSEPNRSSRRRLILNAWYPPNATVSKLPPCHAFVVFNVSGGRLNCHLTQRSADLALGVPFNLASYSLLTMALCNTLGYTYGEFAHTLVDCHVYTNHVAGLLQQTLREPRELPYLRMNTDNKSIFDLRFGDFELANYDPHPSIKFDVAV